VPPEHHSYSRPSRRNHSATAGRVQVRLEHRARVRHAQRPAALRGQFQHARDAHTARRALERELATYNTQSDLDDLHAILDRHSDRETAEIRHILARRAA
jgi:hypothetical protein